MNVIYEEDGEFKVGAVLSQSPASFQVESPHGRRSKIKAASVPGHAVSVLLLQGAVYVRGADEGGVLLNGRALAEGWQPVQSGARIDIGLARLEVTLGGEEARQGWPRTWSVHNVERPSAEVDGSPSIVVDENVWLESEPQPGGDLDDAEVSGLRPSRQFMPKQPSADAPQQPSARPSWLSRASRPSVQDAPSLIGKPQPHAGARWLPYLGGVLMAVAYVLWVTLLDG